MRGGWANRGQRQEKPRLEALLDQRDHLRIQINLMGEADEADTAKVEELQRKLLEIERSINNYPD